MSLRYIVLVLALTTLSSACKKDAPEEAQFELEEAAPQEFPALGFDLSIPANLIVAESADGLTITGEGAFPEVTISIVREPTDWTGSQGGARGGNVNVRHGLPDRLIRCTADGAGRYKDAIMDMCWELTIRDDIDIEVAINGLECIHNEGSTPEAALDLFEGALGELQGCLDQHVEGHTLAFGASIGTSEATVNGVVSRAINSTSWSSPTLEGPGRDCTIEFRQRFADAVEAAIPDGSFRVECRASFQH